MYLFERGVILVSLYDFVWLYSHYEVLLLYLNSKGHWIGKKASSLQNFVYLCSLLNFISKIILAASLYIQVSKSDFKSSQKDKFNRNSLPRGSIRRF